MRVTKGVLLVLLLGVATLWPVARGLAALAAVTTGELVDQSSDIVRAEVVSVESAWNVRRDFIFTTVTVRVTEVFKGGVSVSEQVEVIIPGGVVGEIGLGVEHAPHFETGEDVIVLLRPLEEPTFAVVGWELGKFTIRDEYVIEKEIPLEQFVSDINQAIRGKADDGKGE